MTDLTYDNLSALKTTDTDNSDPVHLKTVRFSESTNFYENKSQEAYHSKNSNNLKKLQPDKKIIKMVSLALALWTFSVTILFTANPVKSKSIKKYPDSRKFRDNLDFGVFEYDELDENGVEELEEYDGEDIDLEQLQRYPRGLTKSDQMVEFSDSERQRLIRAIIQQQKKQSNSQQSYNNRNSKRASSRFSLVNSKRNGYKLILCKKYNWRFSHC